MTEKERNLANIARDLENTQIVNVADLEELEYLQLVGQDEGKESGHRRRALPLFTVVGLVVVIALLGAAFLTASLRHTSRPAAVQSAPNGNH